MNFDDILEKLEADGRILEFKFFKIKIPIYLFVRFMLLQSTINSKFALSNPHITENLKSIKDIIKYIYHTLVSNLFFAPKKDIYIFSSEILNKLENEKYINRLHEDFYNLYKDRTQIIHSSHNKRYSASTKDKIFYLDIINVSIVIFSKFIPKNQKDINTIEAFINYLELKNIFDNDILNQVRKKLILYAQIGRMAIFVYGLFFKLKKPKVILVDNGFYWGSLSFMMYVAKSLSIKVAEYQHGYIGLAHPAYNYHENIFENIKDYCPEFLLTHGKYWSNIIRVPSKKIEIGNPSLMKNIKLQQNKNKAVLFISGGTIPGNISTIINDSYDELVFLGYNVILRPHPSEYLAVEKRYGHLIKKGIKIDKGNLYDILGGIEIVVGLEVSTVLFEAVCFIDKIYLMDTNYSRYYEPNSPFLSFTDSNQLVDSIVNNDKLSYTYDYFWGHSWENNYINFINGII